MSENGTKLDELPEGIALSAKVMDNGEVRARISHSQSGLSLSITSTFETPGACGWQNSHRHVTGIIETYVVQEGWLVVARQDTVSGQPLFTYYKMGSLFTLDGEDAHNVYVSPSAVFACVKYGSREGRKDWVPAGDFDEMVKHLAENDFLPLCHTA
jgi:hypothetical protein